MLHVIGTGVKESCHKMGYNKNALQYRLKGGEYDEYNKVTHFREEVYNNAYYIASGNSFMQCYGLFSQIKSGHVQFFSPAPLSLRRVHL